MTSNWSYRPETPNLGQIWRFLALCDLETWQMTLKNNRAPLLGNIKLYVSFHHHMWIQTGVTVRKQVSWVLTSVTLTFDLWPWPFAWTLPWSLVITPENFMMSCLVAAKKMISKLISEMAISNYHLENPRSRLWFNKYIMICNNFNIKNAGLPRQTTSNYHIIFSPNWKGNTFALCFPACNMSE